MEMCYKSRGLENFLEVTLGNTDKLRKSVNYYRVKMLENNELENIFTPVCLEIDGELILKYNTQAYYMLGRVFEKYKPNGAFLESVMEQLTGCINELSRYLLDANDIVLQPEYMFYSWSDMRLRLICIPGYGENIRGQLKNFLECMMKLFDYKDEAGVKLLYDVYGRVVEGDCNLRGLLVKTSDNGDLITDVQSNTAAYIEEEHIDEYNVVDPGIKKLVPLTNGALKDIVLNRYEEMILVGRGKRENDYRLATTQISRVHACIYLREDGIYVEDRESTNGTYINSNRLPTLQQTRINSGDIVAFANEEFFAV